MKRAFEEAAELFRENEKLSDRTRRQREQTNYYRGLALLAEGLNKLERKFDQIESPAQMPTTIMFRRRIATAAVVVSDPNH